MFGRKHRKARYVKCPYCGENPVISAGPSIEDENKIVMHYECPKKHLTTGDTIYPSRASELWLLAASTVLNVDSVVRDYFTKQPKEEHHGKEHKRKG